MFTLCIIKSDEDFVIVKDKYCEKCLNNKIGVIYKYEINKDEAKEYGKIYGIRGIIVKCECIG